MQTWFRDWSYRWCNTVTPPVLPQNSHKNVEPAGGASLTDEAEDKMRSEYTRTSITRHVGQRDDAHWVGGRRSQT